MLIISVNYTDDTLSFPILEGRQQSQDKNFYKFCVIGADLLPLCSPTQKVQELPIPFIHMRAELLWVQGWWPSVYLTRQSLPQENSQQHTVNLS